MSIERHMYAHEGAALGHLAAKNKSLEVGWLEFFKRFGHRPRRACWLYMNYL